MRPILRSLSNAPRCWRPLSSTLGPENLSSLRGYAQHRQTRDFSFNRRGSRRSGPDTPMHDHSIGLRKTPTGCECLAGRAHARRSPRQAPISKPIGPNLSTQGRQRPNDRYSLSPPAGQRRTSSTGNYLTASGLRVQVISTVAARTTCTKHLRSAQIKRRSSSKSDRRWKIGTGAEVTEYNASVLRVEGRSLIIKYGPELEGVPPEYREWEVRFIGPGTYRWRATFWCQDEYDDVIGVKCTP